MKRVTIGFVALVAVGAAGSLGLLGCGGGTPPPKPPEEAIDTRSSPAGRSVNPNTATTDGESGSGSSGTTDTSSGSASSASTAGTGAGANNSADPSAGLTAATTPPPAGKGGKPGKGAAAAAPAGKTGAIISAADCAKLTDKYIELVISGDGAPLRGTTGKELEQAKEMVKASAASDPNFVNMQKACVKEIHRSQYTCGMNARSATEWQDCIR